MRTRRSWRNQNRLYTAIGRDLQRAADESVQAHAKDVALPGAVGAVRLVENTVPAVAVAPFALVAPAWAPKSAQGDLFDGRQVTEAEADGEDGYSGL